MPQMFKHGDRVTHPEFPGQTLVVQGYLACDEDCAKVVVEGNPDALVDHVDQYDLTRETRS